MKFTHTPTLIGLTGANGTGKDTVAAMLAAELHKHGHAPAVIAFADALYEEVAVCIWRTHPSQQKRRRAV